MKKFYSFLSCLFLVSLALAQVSGPSGTSTVTSCGFYTTNTGIVLSSTGLYLDTIPNPGSIDSSFNLDLTVQAFIDPILTVSAPQCEPNPSFNFAASSSNPLIQTFRWYNQAVGGSLVNVGPTYTESFASTSSRYVIQGGLKPPMPAQTSLIIGGSTGGYWFVAPNSFVITSLFVPTLDSNKFQNIAVLRMDGDINPPTASLFTNDFTTLYQTQVNTARGAIAVNITVNAGDVIGILGSRVSDNSKSNVNNYTVVNGDTIQLTAFGYPGQLTTTSPYNVSSFPLSPNISRVNFEYTSNNVCLNPSRTIVTAVVLPSFLDTVNVSACDSFRVNQQSVLYDYTATIFDTLQSLNGCDSVVRINLTMNYSSLDSIVEVACDSFVAPSGNNYFSNTAFYDTTFYASGCNNIKYIDLTVNSSYSDTANVTVCDVFTAPAGGVYTNDTAFTDTLTSVSGCDSIVFYNVVVNYSAFTLDTIMVCDSFVALSGTTYFSDTSYNDTLSTSLSCDSVVQRLLIVNYSSTIDSLTEVACDFYMSPVGDTYTASAMFYDTLATVNGCDSVIYVDLTINYSSFGFLEPVVCDVYISPIGDIYTSSAFFYDTLSTVHGCDSIIGVNLTIYLKTEENIYPVVCDTYISPIGDTYNSSSIFTDILTTSDGCDSIIHVFLIVNNSITQDLNIIACDEYTSPAGNVYTNSTAFSDTLTNVYTCDSILNINLTIVTPTTETITQVVCDSYVSPSGSLYTSSQLFNDTLSSINGCDSILQIDLTVNYSVFDTVYPAVCAEYTSANGILYTSSGIFTEEYATNGACDSIVTFVIAVDPISLRINKEDGVLESLDFDASYQWIDCTLNSAIVGETGRVFNAPSNGFYAVILDNGECMDTSDCVNVNSIGTGIYWLNNAQISCYPNPSRNQLFISSTENLNGVYFNVYDMNGRKVIDGVLMSKLNTVEIESLEAGMYLVVIDNLRIPIIKLD